MRTVQEFDLSKLSDDQLVALESILSFAQAKPSEGKPADAETKH
jgi:hypothetical protein